MKLQEKIHNQYQEITQFLVNKGIEYWQACDDAKSVSAYVLMTVVDEMMEKMSLDEHTQDRIRRFLETQPSSEQLGLFLGITKEEFDTVYEQKLAQVVQLLPQAYNPTEKAV